MEIAYDTVLQLRTARAWPVFRVPEMAFYRILKNIVENYNAHGSGGLTITMAHISECVELRAVNAYAEQPRPVADATNLGLAIIFASLLPDGGQPAEKNPKMAGCYRKEIDYHNPSGIIGPIISSKILGNIYDRLPIQ